MSTLPVVRVNSSQNIDDGYIVWIGYGNNLTLTLPVIQNEGEHYYIKSETNTLNTLTVNANTGNTINGNSSNILALNAFIHVVALGTDWHIIA